MSYYDPKDDPGKQSQYMPPHKRIEKESEYLEKVGGESLF